MSSALWSPVRLLPVLFAVAACGDSDKDVPLVDAPAPTPDAAPDAAVDAPPGVCDPAGVLPNNFRPIAKASTGAVAVTTTEGVTAGTIDATAGGSPNAADNPYIYIDLRTGTKVEITDLEARTSTAWDVAIKRQSVRSNSGDSGAGDRKIAVVEGTSLAAVTAAPADGYTTDDFTTEDCMLDAIGIGEPNSAIGDWYDYNLETNRLSPKAEIYVIKRPDGTSSAFRLTAYYNDVAGSEKSALYSAEWKQL